MRLSLHNAVQVNISKTEQRTNDRTKEQYDVIEITVTDINGNKSDIVIFGEHCQTIARTNITL